MRALGHRRPLPFAVLFSALILASACTTGGTGPFPDASYGFDATFFDGQRGDDAGMTADRPDMPPMPDTCTPGSMGSTLGNTCTTAADCDDGCFCNGVEQCEGGVCVAGGDPCDDSIACTEDSCLEETNQCFHTPRPEMCADGDACNGAEVCDLSMGCRPGVPLYCNDENACTVDSCDPATGCVFAPRDLDGDGYVDSRCGGNDCDDDPRSGASIHPGAPENCTNNRDDNCDGLRDYYDPTCAPTNDTCASAQALPGPGTYSGSTAGLASDYSLACTTSSGPDAVFTFTLTETKDVRVAVAATGAAVSIRAMSVCSTGPDDRCDSTSPPTALAHSLPAGDYAIIVETTSGTPFELTLTYADPTPVPPVDRCTPTTLDVSGGGTFTGMFSETSDDYRLSCRTSTGFKDAAYRFELTSPKDVDIMATTSGSLFTSSTIIALTTDCSTTSGELACEYGSFGVAAEISRRSLAPGVYYVLLESSESDATDWSLTVDIHDPAPRLPGDACSTAMDITSSPASVSLSTAELDIGTSCGGTDSTYRDVFYRFTLDSPKDVELTTTAPGTHYAALSSGTCGTFSSEIQCRSGSSPLVQSWRSLATGTYYVTVSAAATSGTATAQVVLSPPTPVPMNDQCSGAVDVSGGYSSQDTLAGFADDVTGCSGSGRPDAFYVLHLTGPQLVTALATRPAGSAGPIYLTLRDTCGGPANIACDAGSPSVVSQVLPAGDHTLVVEMDPATAGDFGLQVFVDPPP